MDKKIKVENVSIITDYLTKKYKSGYGIENINIEVNKGMVFGFLGPNGSGKSTTIRNIMGFIKPTKGKTSIKITSEQQLVEYDCWSQSNKIQAIIGYVPGEIAFPNEMTGLELLKLIFKLRNMSNWDDVIKQIIYWEFDPSLKIKKLSKGMKQKLSLCIAWMHNPDILILDEPTAGLDPLMQEKFVSLVKQAKKQGKTIILSSHVFSEVEKTCDNVSIIKNGKIIANTNIEDIKYNNYKTYEIEFNQDIILETISSNNWEIKQDGSKFIVNINNKYINEFLKLLSKLEINYFKEHALTLESYFMQYYKNDISAQANWKINTFKSPSSEKTSKISFELIKHSAKMKFGLWLFSTLFPLFIIISIISSVAPSNENPNSIIQVLIFAIFAGYGFFLPVLFSITLSNLLVVNEVETGTMVVLINTNQSRKTIILTKMFTLIAMNLISILAQLLTIILMLIAHNVINEISFKMLIIHWTGMSLLLFLISSIAFFLSTIFNKKVYSITISTGIYVVSTIFYMLANMIPTNSFEFLKYISINSLYDYLNIGSANNLKAYLGQYITMGVISISLFTGSYFIFIKKDLPL